MRAKPIKMPEAGSKVNKFSMIQKAALKKAKDRQDRIMK
jgi:hypothetical protein